MHLLRAGTLDCRLTDAKMCVDGSVASSSSKVLVLAVWNVEVCLWVAVLLREAEVDDIDLVAALANAHDKVVGLDVTLHEMVSNRIRLWRVRLRSDWQTEKATYCIHVSKHDMHDLWGATDHE